MSKKFERHFKKRGLKAIKLYALTLSLPFYIVYPSKMKRWTLQFHFLIISSFVADNVVIVVAM
jgi:hypothetical protein